MKRRELLITPVLAAALAVRAEDKDVSPTTARLRFGTTPVFLDDQIGFLSRWARYLSGAVGMPVEFVSRRSYRDIMSLLRSQGLDAAWICGYPWVVNRAEVRGLAVPLYQGQPLYRSYLIVPASDRDTASIAELRGKTFAYSDPDSNSGCLVPRTTLMKQGVDPDRHFGRTFYTWGHRNVVSAVATGLAQAGAVDGYVWDTLLRVAPGMVARTRVAWRSEPYGFPPLAVRGTLDTTTEQRLQRALFGMAGDAEGRRLLAELNLDRFDTFRPSLFDSIARLAAMSPTRAG